MNCTRSNLNDLFTFAARINEVITSDGGKGGQAHDKLIQIRIHPCGNIFFGVVLRKFTRSKTKFSEGIEKQSLKILLFFLLKACLIQVILANVKLIVSYLSHRFGTSKTEVF